MRRIITMLAISATLCGITTASATAAGRIAVVSRLSSTAGPLAASKVSLAGRNLDLVRAVRFGRSPATRLRHFGRTGLTLLAPSSRRPGRVTVSVNSAGRWRSAGSYTYVARPVVSSLSRSTVTLPGGGSLVVGGRHLAWHPSVTIGGARAVVTLVRDTALTVRVPLGVQGVAGVVVRTAGGSSTSSTVTRLQYVQPAAADASAYTTAPDTVTATGVQWVSERGITGGQPTSWIVSVASGGAVPPVDTPYYLAPGGTALPSGLAGTITSIAAQPDGSTRLTIAPAPLDATLSSASIRFADGPNSAGGTFARRSTEVSTASEVSFPNLGPNVFGCKNKQGQTVSFSGEIGLRFERFDRNFSLVLGAHPSIDAFVTGTVVTFGKVTVAGAVSCSVKALWGDANKKDIPLGATGATLSVGPTAQFKISGAGTVSFEQKTQFMYGLAKYGDNPVQYYKVAKQSAMTAHGSATLTVDASAGLSIQIGLADRVGVQIKDELYVAGNLTAKTNPLQVCADLGVGVKVAVGAFLDLFIQRWEANALQVKLEFAHFAICSLPDSDAPPTTAPQIVSSRLPDASSGQSYTATLTLSDNRLGAWHLVTTLPPGLSLSTDGVISGATTGVGTYRPQVRFVDAQNRSSDATLLLYVIPDPGLGGGDIQATLTWSSAADLDLHAIEPDGNEIYFANAGPSDHAGQLDHDANRACEVVDPAPAENIHWPSQQAAEGQYQFAVVTWSTCDATDLSWHLVVRVRGQVVIDQTGSGDSDWYTLDYATGAVTARQLATHPAVHRTTDAGGTPRK